MEIYVGYFLTGKERKTPFTMNADQCERDASHKITHGGFCPECGGMVVTVPHDGLEVADIYDIPENEGALEDRFIFPEYISREGEFVAISNYTTINGAHFTGDGGFYTFNEKDKEAMYEAFMKLHENDIRLLEKYVFDDVKINFGTVGYYL